MELNKKEIVVFKNV